MQSRSKTLAMEFIPDVAITIVYVPQSELPFCFYILIMIKEGFW